MATAAIGLDLGTSSVRAAQLSLHRGQPRLEALGQVALPEGAVHDGEVIDGAAVASALRQLWKHSRLSGKKVSVGVASSRVIVRQVDLPWMAAEDLKGSLSFSVEEMLPVSVDQVFMDFCPLEEVEVDGARLIRGLLVAAPRELVRSNIAAVEAAKLKPVAVDLSPLAVLRCGTMAAEFDMVDSAPVSAVIEIGASVTSVIIREHDVPQFVRIIAQGGATVTSAVAQRLGVDHAYAEAVKQEMSALGYVSNLQDGVGEPVELSVVERAIDTSLSELMSEIRGSLEYFAASSPAPVQQVVLCGGGSRLTGLTQRLSDALELPVHVANPLAGLHIGNTGLSTQQLEFLSPLSAVPVGLALGALS